MKEKAYKATSLLEVANLLAEDKMSIMDCIIFADPTGIGLDVQKMDPFDVRMQLSDAVGAFACKILAHGHEQKAAEKKRNFSGKSKAEQRLAMEEEVCAYNPDSGFHNHREGKQHEDRALILSSYERKHLGGTLTIPFHKGEFTRTATFRAAIFGHENTTVSGYNRHGSLSHQMILDGGVNFVLNPFGGLFSSDNTTFSIEAPFVDPLCFNYQEDSPDMKTAFKSVLRHYLLACHLEDDPELQIEQVRGMIDWGKEWTQLVAAYCHRHARMVEDSDLLIAYVESTGIPTDLSAYSTKADPSWVNWGNEGMMP